MSIRSIGRLLLAGLAVVAGACEPPPEAEAPARIVRPPPQCGEFLIDRETGQKYRRSPNRRVHTPNGPLAVPIGDLAATVQLRTSFSDDTGTVHTQIVECFDNVAARHNTGISCEVDPEFVVVGGGAEVFGEFFPDFGALLTESRPLNSDLRAWVASSKDHRLLNDHNLRVFAIGLRLEGVSDDQLWPQMHLRVTRSAKDAHPAHTTPVASGFTLIGGGASLAHANDCGGNLLTGSFRDGDGWRGTGKDHANIPCSTEIRVSAIGIRPTIAGFGTLDIRPQQDSFFFNTGSFNGGRKTIELELAPGFAPASLGGRAEWAPGQGRLLWRIRPDNRKVIVSDKEHVDADATGTIRADIIGIRRR